MNSNQFKVGDKILITTNEWFTAPDGSTYKSAWGTVAAIETAEETLGVRTNARSTNWYLRLGSMLIAGCQIHYAISTDKVNLGPAKNWSTFEGKLIQNESPSMIYNADEEYK
jgi:hypothetical protein